MACKKVEPDPSHRLDCLSREPLSVLLPRIGGKFPSQVILSERHFENNTLPILCKPQLLKSRGTQLAVRDFFPTQLINETLRGKPRHASLMPGRCAVTLSRGLAPAERITDALKVRPAITTLPPAFWLRRASLPRKVSASLTCPSRRQGLEDTVRCQPHLPPATRPWPCVSLLPGPSVFHQPSGDNRDLLPSSHGL